MFTINPSATIQDIVADYNIVAEYNGNKTVKSFKDRPTAVSRLLAVLPEAGSKLRKLSTVVSDDATVTLTTAPTDADAAPTKPAAKGKGKGKKTAPAKRGPKSGFTALTFTPTMDVEQLRRKVRPGTHLFAQLAFIIKHSPELTVGEIYEKYNRAGIEGNHLDPAARPSTRPGWINNATFAIALRREILIQNPSAQAAEAA